MVISTTMITSRYIHKIVCFHDGVAVEKFDAYFSRVIFSHRQWGSNQDRYRDAMQGITQAVLNHERRFYQSIYGRNMTELGRSIHGWMDR